jgi:Holliday junction resolvase RusA-like endonuclease
MSLESPPESGEITITLPLEPVSLQAPPLKKNAITRAIREAIGDVGFLFTGEVEVGIEWLVHERARYYSAHSPDIDNVIKVALDALCGPSGIIINDRQVQAVSCHWIDWTAERHQTTISVKALSANEWLPKAGLVFVRIRRKLCFPFLLGVDSIGELEIVMRMVATYEEVLRKTGDHYAAKYLLPSQQLFHSSLLRGFRVIEPAEFKREVEQTPLAVSSNA